MLDFTLSLPRSAQSSHVCVGSGIVAECGPLLRWHVPEARRALIVTNEPVAALYGGRIEHSLRAAGFEVSRTFVGDGERWKTIESAAHVYDAALDARIDRADAIVSLGGGVVTDLAGFAAATYLRGVTVAHCPTTVLAQVDAAIGGKTGVNVPRGKNLVGAFHQPVLVVSDVDTLRTLPIRERNAGLAEVVKCAMIADADLFAAFEDGRILADDPASLLAPIARAARIKAGIVERDERESGERMHLNFGHTVGHAIEAATSYTQYLHGEAVAIGMAFAVRLGRRLGLTDASVVERLEAVLTRTGLPVAARGVRAVDVLDKMQHDKKIRAGHGRFVLTPSVGSVSVAARVPDEAIAASLTEVLR